MVVKISFSSLEVHGINNRRESKIFFIVVLFLKLIRVPSVFFFLFLLQGCEQGGSEVTEVIKQSPVAEETIIESTIGNWRDNKKRIEYSGGVLIVDRRYNEYSSIKHDSMFLDVETAWPDFGDSVYFSRSDHIDRIRFLFEIRRKIPLKDLYSVFLDKQHRGELEENPSDYRFPGLLG